MPTPVKSKHPTDIRIGAILVDERTKLGLTQTQVAQKAGVRQQYVSNAEEARTTLTLGVLTRICAGLGLDASKVLKSAQKDQLRPVDAFDNLPVSTFLLVIDTLDVTPTLALKRVAA